MALIHRLFDAMRAADNATVREVFRPEARVVTTRVRDGEPEVQVVPIERFIAAVGRGHQELSERIRDWEVRIDDNLATVWTKYDFHIAGEFSHCGVDAFQLVRTDGDWKIIQVADTQQTEGCER